MNLCTIDQVFAEENRRFSSGAHDVYISSQSGIRKDSLAHIAPLVEKSIADGFYPGAVILVSHRGQIIYRGVFGCRQVVPEAAPMQFDTIFDFASLTKVVVTTTAVMQLIEAGRLDLDAYVSNYWPAFAKNGKESVTIRELLTHTSGFQAILPVWDTLTPLQQIEQIGLINPPGKVFTYSDLSFIALGHIVELISGESLAPYAQNHILQPLNMTSTTFLPPMTARDRIAPTSSPESQELRWGVVNDPTTERMGGVSGVAGLFGNASDLAIFSQCLLNGGRISGDHYLLGPLTVLKMSTPQTPPGILDVRGLGWDIDSRFSNRGVLLPISSFGHSGWTGTSIWIDPVTQTSIIILTSRSHPLPVKKNQLIIDRRAIANIVAGSLTDVDVSHLNTTGEGELQNAYSKRATPTQ